MGTFYTQFQQHVAEINDLLNTINILRWDARTQMPPGGSETRGNQLATLSKIAQERFISDTTARLLDGAESEVANDPKDSYRLRAVRQTRHYYELVKRIPAAVAAERAELTPTSENVWAVAKKNNDFASFAECRFECGTHSLANIE